MRNVGLLIAFLLGACATAVVQSSETSALASSIPMASPHPEVRSWTTAPHRRSPTGTATVAFLASGNNAFVGRLEMEAGAAVPTHRDSTEEFIVVLEGSGTMVIDGKQYQVSSGTTVYMPANVEVSFQNGDHKLVAIQVFAGPEPAAKYDAWNPA